MIKDSKTTIWKAIDFDGLECFDEKHFWNENEKLFYRVYMKKEKCIPVWRYIFISSGCLGILQKEALIA